MELQEQHRIAQETIIFKVEQLRETQAWMPRAQEMDALQSTTNHTLQTELRERTEHYNQIWLACQRQFGEMERLHLHIQQLQHELADAREKTGSNMDGSNISQKNLKDASELGQSQHNVNSNSSSSSVSVQNGNPESVSGRNASMQAQPDDQHVPTDNQYAQGAEQNLVRASSNLDYEDSGNGQLLCADDLEPNISRGLDADSVQSANGDGKVLDCIEKNYDNTQVPDSLQQVSSDFHDVLRLDHLAHGDVNKEKQANTVNDHGTEDKGTMKNSDLAILKPSEIPNNVTNSSENSTGNASSVDVADAFISAGQKTIAGKNVESYLLDERALLASIARSIGSGGRIRISSTLPNRLGKMLAPLHWHDYKKKYGKLDDFIAGHPELFFIEGDYIQLREGAQGIIAATATVAKVAAAAAAAPSSYSSLLPSVAVTPMAQSHRLKKASPLNSSYADTDKGSYNEFSGPRPLNADDHPSQFLAVQSQNINVETSNVRILSKGKDHLELNGNETGLGRPTLQPVGNRDKTDFSQSKGGSHGRPGMNSVGKHQSRGVGALSNARR